jgi:hypothetical protein
MNKFYIFGFLFLSFVFSGLVSNASAQQEVYSGTLVSYCSGFPAKNQRANF